MQITSDAIVSVHFGEVHHCADDTPIVCPVCDQPPIGMEQVFTAAAGVSVNENGMLYYNDHGTDTEELWNSSKDAECNGLPILVCEDGHQFTHPKAKNIQ